MRGLRAAIVAVAVIFVQSIAVIQAAGPHPSGSHQPEIGPDATGSVSAFPDVAKLPPGSNEVQKTLQPRYSNPDEVTRLQHEADLAERAAENQKRPAPKQRPPTPFALLGTSGVQAGLGAAESCASNCTPPDSTGSINSSYYLEFVNTRLQIYNRSLAAFGSSVDLGSFAFPSGVPSGQAVTDPQINWDQANGRWLYALISDDPNSANHAYLLWGWSKTADPTNLTSGWCKYAVQTNSDIDDYPKLGHDSKSLVIGANDFPDAGGALVTAKIWVVKLPADGTASCPTASYMTFGSAKNPLKNNDGSTTVTPVPADTGDNGTNDYIVSAHVISGGNQSKIMAWHVVYSKSGSPSLAVDGDFTVNSYGTPPTVPQPNSSNVIFTFPDGRLDQAVSESDPDVGSPTIWTQHTIHDPNGSAFAVVRWYELVPATMSARQQGDVVSTPTATNTFNGAVSPTSSGNEAAIFYNQGDASQLALIEAETRLSTTPLSTMDIFSTTLASSSVADNDPSCSPGPCRWGDYAGASPDPGVPHQVWGTSQTTGNGGTPNNIFGVGGTTGWGTYNFSVTTILQPTCRTTTTTAGENHSLAVDVNGNVWAWGLGNSGQIGNDLTSNALNPTEVWAPSGTGWLTGVKSVAATQTASFAVLSNGGAVYYWGSPNLETQSLIPSPQPDPVNDRSGFLTGVTAIAAGWQHVIVLKSNGTVWAWGQDVYGQLGNGSSGSNAYSTTPVQVGSLVNVIAIAAGHDDGYALLSDGSVWAWGDNQFGQLGQNTGGPGSLSDTPVQVKGPNGVGTLAAIYLVSGGPEAGGAMAVSSDLSVWAWGTASPGLSAVPAHVPTSNGTGAFASNGNGVISGFNHRLLIDTVGMLWSYGPDNTYGQLGNGNNSPSTDPTKVQQVGGGGQLSLISEVAAGLDHSVALDISGNIYAWGLGTSGQLGNGGMSNSNTPVQVSLSHLIAQAAGC